MAWLVVAGLCASMGAAVGPAADARSVSAEQKQKSKSGKRGGKRATSKPTTQEAEPPASEPSAPGGEESVSQARRRLARIPADRRTAADHALLTALEFSLALARPDGPRAARCVDAVGYQPLPAIDELPEKPAKPLLPAAVEQMVAPWAPAKVEDLPLACFEVRGREALRELLPAAAEWMLPQDRAVVFRPPSTGSPSNWPGRETFVIVRIRADKATLVAGNLLEVLAAVQEAGLPEGEEK